MNKTVQNVRSDGLPSVPEALRILDRLKSEVEHAETFVQLQAIADKAAAWQRAFRPVADVSSRAGHVGAKAEWRLGVELAKLPRAPGGQPYQSTGANSEPVDRAPTLAELDIDKKRSARAQKLAMLSPEMIDEIAAELAAAGKAVSPASILAAQRQEAKRNKIHAVATAAFSSDGPFGTVVIDPPWKMEKIDRDVRPNQDAFDYQTMSEEEIASHWRAEINGKLEGDCHLFMWTTQKFLPAALRLVEIFGFRYVLTMVWHKPGGFQPIGLPQYNCEFVVYARQGAPVFVDMKDFNCCFYAPRREHSRKPDEFYDVVRRVTGGSRIDVFSREARDGFAQYGNEVGKFGGAS